MKKLFLLICLLLTVGLISAQTSTFNYVGSIETYTVPTGVYLVKITAAGAEGGFGTSSIYDAGRGAVMEGYFAVTPGQQLQILVGERPTSGNGGGGGTFVCDVSNNPWIAAGGGGGASQVVDDTINKHGQITTVGGTGAAGGGLGGDNGNGGAIGASFSSGAGGGLLTDGTDGWTTNTGGTAFVNGGTVATGASAHGGYGGGGCGSGYVIGGGGGGYSGGGSGSNSVGGGGVGGGGGSYNSGAFQNNVAGANTGHGYVIIEVARGTSFAYTGTIDDFVVPNCIYKINVEVAGAEGGLGSSSVYDPGMGAVLSGEFNVMPGDTFNVLVGEKPASNNGGGGGTFFVKSDNTPYIIAGGGGGASESVDDGVNKHGQAGTAGGTGAAGGGLGGDNGNGGAIGASFSSGAGGGLLTDGTDGWTTNTGGTAFVNGGTAATGASAHGGFGGGGCGSGYVVGGGGGGYSGGGSGSNSVGGGGVGGGGGSYNAGMNPLASAGANTGHGYVIIIYDSINPFYNSSILASDSICAGDTMMVAVSNASAADTIAWSSDNGEFISYIDDTTAYFVFYNGATTLNAHVYAGSCFDSLLSFTVYVDSVTVSYTVTHSSTGSDGEIIASASGFGTVEFNIDGGTWQSSGTFSSLAPGIYSIGRMDSFGCAYYDSVEVMDASFISENFASQVIMYPNPTSNELNVSIGMDVDEVLLQITDMSGRIIRSEIYTSVRNIKLNVSDLNSGVYMISISSEEGAAIMCFVKE